MARRRWLAALLVLASAPRASRAQDADAPGEIEVAWFDVGALTSGAAQHLPERGPRVVPPDQVNDERAPLFGGEGEEAVRPVGGATELIEWLKSTTGRVRTWDAPEVSVSAYGEALILVRGPRPLLEAVDASLVALLRSVRPTVTVDVAVLQGDASGLREGGFASAVGRALAPLAAARSCGIVEQRITGRQGGIAAFVQDHDVEVAQKAKVPDPIVGVRPWGLAFDAQAQIATPERVRLTVNAWWARLGEMRTLEPPETGLVQLPLVDVREASATLDLVPGAWSPLPASGGSGVVFAVRATVRPWDVPAGRLETLPVGPATAPGALRRAMVDLGDLGARVLHRRGPRIDVTPSSYTPPEPPELPDPAQVFGTAALVDSIKAVGGRAWDEDGFDVDVRGRWLAVRADDARLATVDRVVSAARARALRSATLRLTVVRLPVASVPEWWSGLPDELVAADGASLAARQGARVLGRASLRLLSGQRDASFAGRQRSYVSDYDVEIAEDATIANPVVHMLLEGLSFDAAAHAAPGGGGVVVEARLDRSELAALARVPTHSGEVECPDLGLLRMRGSLAIPYGATRLVGAGLEGPDLTLLLLSAE